MTFLSWAAEPEMDDRKLMGAKFITVLSLCLITAVYYKRWKWAPLKSRRCGFFACGLHATPTFVRVTVLLAMQPETSACCTAPFRLVSYVVFRLTSLAWMQDHLGRHPLGMMRRKVFAEGRKQQHGHLCRDATPCFDYCLVLAVVRAGVHTSCAAIHLHCIALACISPFQDASGAGHQWGKCCVSINYCAHWGWLRPAHATMACKLTAQQSEAPGQIYSAIMTHQGPSGASDGGCLLRGFCFS